MYGREIIFFSKTSEVIPAIYNATNTPQCHSNFKLPSGSYYELNLDDIADEFTMQKEIRRQTFAVKKE
ncbi:hypothetical protein C0J52_02194 [Blattella germanica]|nr:hypothetical protein C0J52_02194 [Blattella germanica]